MLMVGFSKPCSPLKKGTGPLRSPQIRWKWLGPERSSPLFRRAARSPELGDTSMPVDRNLASGLRTAIKVDATKEKTKAWNFVLVIKEAGWGTMIVRPKPIDKDDIETAKKELGGAKKLIKGRCSGDGKGGLIFETGKAPDTELTKTLREVISKDAGMPSVKFEARKAGDLTDVDDDKAKEAINKRLKAMLPWITAMLKAAEGGAKPSDLPGEAEARD